LLPPRSSLGSPGTIGSSASSRPRRFFRSRRDSPLMHFDATLSVLLLRLPRPSPSHVDHDPERIVPRISFFTLQHLRIREPFFSLPLSWKRRRNLALILRSLTLGFGYPLDEMVWLSHPGGPLSIPNALGLRSSELSSFRAIEKTLSGISLRSCAFRQNLYDLAPALQRLAPTQKAVPLIAPRVFSSGRDRCSLEPSGLSGSPSVDPWKRPSPSLPSPLVLLNPQPYDKKFNEPQGLANRQLGCSPHYRAPTCLAFWTFDSLPPLKKVRRHRTIFSSRRPFVSCGPKGASLWCLRPSA